MYNCLVEENIIVNPEFAKATVTYLGKVGRVTLGPHQIVIKEMYVVVKLFFL